MKPPLRFRTVLIAGLAAAAATVFVLPPIAQDPLYHAFAARRTIADVPNFWNVISNLPFLLVAARGLRALRSRTAFLQNWERAAYKVLLAGLALASAGSTYYHLQPNNATLFWDRLPMTIIFMALLASTIGERISMRTGRLLFFPLLAAGAASVLWWLASDDLRPYVLVQFYPMLALPLMWTLFPPRYSGAAGLWSMMGLYVSAKLLELFDHEVAVLLPSGGHPWKHVAAALAMLCYIETVARRRPSAGPPRALPVPVLMPL